MELIERIKKDLENTLSEHRYQHSLRVADVAFALAKKYDCDTYKAYVAGLVHDIAKEYSKEENIKILKQYNMLDSVDLDDKTIHGAVGALVIKKYNLSSDICHAVYAHTLGDTKMNLLDKIVFVADKIEPLKDYDGIEEERKLSFIDIDEALILCMKNNHKKVLSKGKTINQKSLEVLEFLENAQKNNN